MATILRCSADAAYSEDDEESDDSDEEDDEDLILGELEIAAPLAPLLLLLLLLLDRAVLFGGFMSKSSLVNFLGKSMVCRVIVSLANLTLLLLEAENELYEAYVKDLGSMRSKSFLNSFEF